MTKYLVACLLLLPLILGGATATSASAANTIETELNQLVDQNEPADSLSARLMKSGRIQLANNVLKTADTQDIKSFSQLLLSTYILQNDEDLNGLCDQWLNSKSNAEPSSRALVLEFKATALAFLKKFQAAAAAIKLALKLDPTNASLKATNQNITATIQSKPTNSTDARPRDFGNRLLIFSTAIPVEETWDETSVSQLNPDVKKLAELARTAEKRGALDEAAKLLTQACEKAPNSATLLGELALCHMTKSVGDGEQDASLLKAEDALKKAMNLEPSNWKYKNNLAAETYLRAGNDAIDLFNELSKNKTIPEMNKQRISAAYMSAYVERGSKMNLLPMKLK